MKSQIRFVLVALSVFMLLQLVGCSDQSEGTGLTDPFIGGTTGLKLDFVENAPPEDAYDKGTFPFDVAVQLENVGEYTVERDNIYVKISGFDPADFDKTPADMKKNPGEDVRKTYKNSENRKIEGTVTTVEFNGFNYQGNLTGNTPFQIKADVCYDYGTTANSMLCYRENVLDPENDEDDLCDVNEDKKTYNSGAPVQVENLKENARGTDRIGFNFDIKHKGTGDIFRLGSGCNSSDRSYEDVIYVTVDTGMDGGLNCSSLSDATSGYVKLYGDHKTVSCVQDIENPSDFEKPVVITLAYGYEEDKTTEIMIKHATD